MNHHKYPLSIRVFHWVTAAVILGQIIFGFLMEDLPKSVIKYHLIVGVFILSLALIRIGLRIANKHHMPGRPPKLSSREWLAAKMGHWLLYLTIIALPLTGVYGYLGKNHDVLEIHETLVWIFIVLVCGHMAAVLGHIFIHKVNIMKRIV